MALNEKKEIFPANPAWNTRFKSYVFADDLNSDLRAAFRDAEGLLAGAELIKNSRSTTAGIFRLNGTEYFIKRSNVNSFFDRLRRIGRMSRADRNLVISNVLTKAGVRVPEIFMVLSTAPGALPGASYLITEAFSRPMTANGTMQQMLECYGSHRKLVEELSGMANKIHNAGVEHGDFKMNNILSIAGKNGGFELGVFDFDGSILHKKSCINQVRRADLARMASSYFLRCHTLGIYSEKDFSANARLWAEVYAGFGNADFSNDKQYLQRQISFLPSDIKKGIKFDG